MGGDTACFVALILSNDCFATFDSFSDGLESVKLFLSLFRFVQNFLCCFNFLFAGSVVVGLNMFIREIQVVKMLVNLLQRFLIYLRSV